MNNLQEDLLEIYNNLVELNKVTQEENPKPIRVRYDGESLGFPLVFEYGGTTVRLRLPIYYCLGLTELGDKTTYLLPKDYEYLMTNLEKLIYSDQIIEDRTHVSPENYGFDIYSVDPSQIQEGLRVLGRVRFVSGNSWLFKLIVRLKWKSK